jgi:predicted nucleotidyltransferase
MANFHSDEWIMARLNEHYKEAKTLIDESRIVALCLQGSQNYGLDYAGSDIDTKLIIVPSFEDIVFNRRPMSTTHVRHNNEHIDIKDFRLYRQCFEKQNLNFLEILFTPYKIVNPQYEQWWNRLVENREAIAHYDIHRAIKSMKGIAMEKYHAMEHKYPSKVDIIEKYGYDSKQLHHLMRVENYLMRYMAGESYESCLIPDEETASKLRRVKEDNGYLSLEQARTLAGIYMGKINGEAEKYLQTVPEEYDKEVEALLNEVQYDIMKFAVTMELVEEE